MQRPPPKGGYPFPKNNHVTTKMGKLPPSPCRSCGSDNHWDKECPDNHAYVEKVRRSVNLTESSPETEGEKAYATAYSILLNERLVNDMVEQSDLNESLERQGFEAASASSQTIGEERSKTEDDMPDHGRRPQRASLEEVEDEYWKTYEAKPKSSHHVLEEVVLEKEASHAAKPSGVEPNFRSPPTENPSLPEEIPLPDRKIKLKKRRFTPAGTSAVGVSVVAVQGYVGSTRNALIDLRLDSCADVTDISRILGEFERPSCLSERN